MTKTLRLGLLAASPMYYQAPLYRRIAHTEGIDFTAIFASSGGVTPRDVGFGMPLTWDIDVLAGYRYLFLKKADSNPIGGGLLTLHDWDIVPLIAKEKFDVLWIHGYNVMTNLMAAVVQRSARRPILLREEQTLLAPRARWKHTIKSLALPLVLGRATAVYIGSENRRWLQHFGFPEQRLFSAPYCVDAERLQRSASMLPDSKSLRKRFGIEVDEPVILSVSRLAPTKQPLELLDAFARVRRLRRCVLLIVGTGELEGAMRAKVERETIPDVKFAGFLNQTDIAAAYCVADVFALFSQYEPWGLVVNEAMHLGLPVVASDRVGAAADLVKEGKTGHVVQHRDVQALADRLADLVADPQLRRRMGAAAREHAADWNYERAASGIVTAARAAAARSSR